MRISDVMARTGVTRETVRHYEDIGLLHAAHFCRRANGYRDYNESAVERILFVKKGQSAGFTLRQIVKVADEWESDTLPLATKQMIINKQLADIDQRIADLLALKAELEALLAETH
ncbi:MerR family transcriptional regulator [bacterium]|nr:MerR family transcriptional regulator [bacterium]